jgi:hypothetical protein
MRLANKMAAAGSGSDRILGDVSWSDIFSGKAPGLAVTTRKRVDGEGGFGKVCVFVGYAFGRVFMLRHLSMSE